MAGARRGVSQFRRHRGPAAAMPIDCASPLWHSPPNRKRTAGFGG